MNTPTPTYDLAFFKAFFSSRPASTWISWDRDDGHDRHCAIGHTNALGSDGRQNLDTPMTVALIALFQPLASSCAFGWSHGIAVVTGINNGNHRDYRQDNPRDRILAAIDDLMAMEVAKEAMRLEAVETRPLVPVSRTVNTPTEALVEAS